MSDFSRRRLLCALGAAGAAAAAGCRRYAGPAPVAMVPAGWHRGEERWIATTCGQCPAGCGVRVRVYEGRAVKIEGAPEHPINGGGIGPKGQAGLQLLYHPDRIRGPLRRDGARGSGRWVEISWDDAIVQLAGALGALRQDKGPHGLVVVDGEARGPVPRLWDRFLTAYGSPNHVSHLSTGDAAKVLTMSFMHGIAEIPAYDWKETEYVLGFGVSLFESWCQTIHMTRATGAMRRGRPGRRVKFVHVSPDFSVTAAKADEWVPIQPGTYGALALGLGHVLVRDNLFDAAFVGNHTFGFESWRDKDGRAHRGFRDVLLTDYPPGKVAQITGASAATIERLARELHAHRPAIALSDGIAAASTNALASTMAIHSLNALLGSLERPGGVLVRPPAPPAWKPVQIDETARRGLSTARVDGGGTASCPLGTGAIQQLPDAILAGRPNSVDALLFYRSNPVFSKPEGAKWIEAIQKVPLVVSFSPLPDESTLWADLVLPDHTYLERWEFVEPAPSSGRPVIGLRQPVVRPRHNTMASGDVIVRLARAMGAPMAEAFPWATYRDAMLEHLQSVAPETALAALQKDGVWSREEAFERPEEAFRTPSRKFEFYSQAIAARLDAHRTAAAETNDHLCLPHWEAPRYAGDASEYPFLLAPYRTIGYAEGGVRHLPWLRELPASGFLAWKEVIDLNPQDAHAMGVRQGDVVSLESPIGQRRMHVRLTPGTRPGTIGLPLGHGPWPATTEDAGSASHGLVAALSDPLTGILAHQGTRVRVRKEA